MTDRFIVPVSLRRSYWATASRWAVINPLFRRGRTTAAILRNTQRLIIAWRARLEVLRREEAFHLADPDIYQRIRNCAPAFVVCDPRTNWRCKWEMACPFCWARRAARVWTAAFTSFGEDFAVTAPQHRLIVRRAGGMVECRDNDELVRQIRVSLAGRKVMAERFEAFGGYSVVQASPVSGHPHRWRISIRQLFKVDRDAPAVEPRANERLRYVDDLTKKKLASAVACVCRYPAFLLHGDPARTRIVLDLQRTRRLRCSWLFGDFQRPYI